MPEREFKYAAIDLLAKHHKRLDLAAVVNDMLLRAFLAQHAQQLSDLTRREAGKHLG